MKVMEKEYNVKGIIYTIRSAVEKDAKELSAVRLQVDGETENMDRERGEAYIDPKGFVEIIKSDSAHPRNIF